MFATPAYAQTAAGAPAGGGIEAMLLQIAPLIGLFVLFYFLLIRPQQKPLKRNDVVVLASGVVGKIVRVEDGEVGVEIAQGVTVKVVKSMISSVRSKGDAAANDAKA